MALGKLSPTKQAEAGVEIPILHPETDLPLGVYVTIYGADSKIFKDIQRRQTNHRLEIAANKNKNKKSKITAEGLEAEALELLVGCIKGWRTEIKGKDDDGKEQVKVSRPAEIELDEGEWLTCTPENVRRVFEILPWFKEQIDEAIGDRSNFLQS